MNKVIGETQEYKRGWKAYIDQAGMWLGNPYEPDTAAHYAYERGWDDHYQLSMDNEANDEDAARDDPTQH